MGNAGGRTKEVAGYESDAAGAKATRKGSRDTTHPCSPNRRESATNSAGNEGDGEPIQTIPEPARVRLPHWLRNRRDLLEQFGQLQVVAVDWACIAVVVSVCAAAGAIQFEGKPGPCALCGSLPPIRDWSP